MECYAQGYCKKYGEDGCNGLCDVYVVLDAIYIDSNMPKKYRKDIALKPSKEDLESYKKLDRFKKDILEKVSVGDGVYVYSRGTGNGKTSWVTKIANYYVRKMIFSKKIEDLIYFVNVPTFLEELRQAYGDKNKISLDKLYNSKILILDDIGSEKPSEWVQERLYTLIDFRVNNELSTLYTSNLTLDELRDKLGDRIVSRIKGSNEVIQLIGADRRRI